MLSYIIIEFQFLHHYVGFCQIQSQLNSCIFLINSFLKLVYLNQSDDILSILKVIAKWDFLNCSM